MRMDSDGMRRKVKLKKHGSNIEVAVYNMPLKKQTIRLTLQTRNNFQTTMIEQHFTCLFETIIIIQLYPY